MAAVTSAPGLGRACWTHLIKLCFAFSSPKPPPPEGVKSNPSKRHRDRLNEELNKLTGLLPFPEDVCTRFDKLSTLRLAVGYLKVKNYLMAVGTDVGNCMLDQPRAPGGNGQTHLQVNREPFPEGDLLLQALNGFVITVAEDGSIFYISPTVQNYLGFRQVGPTNVLVSSVATDASRAMVGITSFLLCERGVSFSSCVVKTGKSGTTVFRVLTKRGTWVWLQASAWLVYKGGEPDCIIARQRVLSNEEGEEHLRKRNLQLPFSLATGEAILYGNNFPSFLGSFQAKEEFHTKTDSHTEQHAIDPKSILGAVMAQDTSIYLSHTDVPQFTLPDLDAEPDGPSQDGKVGHDKDSSSLLVAIEALFEKSEVDGNISQSLGVDSTELQQWEDALLSLEMEELPSEDFGERLSSELPSYTEQMLFREGDGKSMEFLHCSEEGCSVAQFQHWGFNPEAPQAFEAPQQPHAAGAQGQDVVLSGSSAPAEQQILVNPASLEEGMLLDALGSSSKPCAADQLVNSGLEFQAGLSTSIPIDTIVPDCQSQSECTLMGLSCPPPLDSSTLVSQWHDVPVWANLDCPLDAWMAASKQLGATGASLESQTALTSSSQSWGSFPRQPHCSGEQVLLSKDAWPQPQGLVIMLHHYKYRTTQGAFRHGDSFLGDAVKIPTSALPRTNHPGTLAGLSLSCSASPCAQVGARASCEPGAVLPLSSLAGRQPLCACHVQLKVWGRDCRT
uniref:BHLH domain-containing protein n=1 Tax=Pavo cristatus TaxID=9049 RepID=A0A8C9EVT7_PAVCR